MTITHEFKYFKPRTLTEAIPLLSRHGKKASVLAGGTDLIVCLKDGLRTPDAVVDIKDIPELKKLEFKSGALFIGALVTFSDLIESEIIRKKFPLLAEVSKTVASAGIRNRATLAGNICSAVPSLDGGPVLLVYEAVIHIRGPRRERKLPISEWFVGPKKNALQDGELVAGLSIPLPKIRSAGCYLKLGRYAGEDLASVGVCVLSLSGNRYRIAFCAVGPTPKRAFQIEKLLEGQKPTDALLQKAAELVPDEISPITDIRASKKYRTHMTCILLKKGIRTAAARLGRTP